MMLMPKKSKYLKPFTNKKIIKHNKKQNNLKFAKICLISAEAGFIPNFQISAIKLFLRKNLKKRGQIFIRLFPNQPITKKANETRLGRGKGNLKYWSFFCKKGKIIIEINSYNLKLAKLLLQYIKFQLTVKSFLFNLKFRWIL